MTDTEPYVRDDVRALLDLLGSLQRPELDEVPIEQVRQSMSAMQTMVERPARDLPVIRDLSCPGPAGDIPLRLYDAQAERREAGPLLLFLHGGGFVAGDLESHHALCTELAAELDLPLLAVDYRLAPEHPFPAAPEDAEAAARWAAKSPHELSLKVSGLIPIGDSAGGNLAIVTTQALVRDPAMAPVVLQVPIYPLTDDITRHPSYRDFAEGFLLSSRAMAFFTASYAPVPQDPRNHPILARHEGTPPTVVATASLDPLRDSGRAYAARLVEAGVDVIYLEMRGSIHGFANLRKAIPSAQKDLHAIISATKLLLERHL
ncbi:alpha/beta hydrolase [Altericroceibacterium xinjiangense]|uniref:alpha/beta hydrolase n=1 Tax=Altericroceibacterium xinjiangense TaxID=762261 RepID=UPI000F7F93A5|nr:alpha/beta hydrolase [Altericroceibacterium xinjiangense]